MHSELSADSTQSMNLVDCGDDLSAADFFIVDTGRAPRSPVVAYFHKSYAPIDIRDNAHNELLWQIVMSGDVLGKDGLLTLSRRRRPVILPSHLLRTAVGSITVDSFVEPLGWFM